MRAGCPCLRACLSACVGRKPGNGFGVDILAAPAMMRPGLLDQGRIAARAAPALGLVRALVLLPLLHLVCVPFLHTVKVGYGPANRAGPHLGAPENFVCANDALVLAVVDILMDSRGQVCCRGFWHGRPPLFPDGCRVIGTEGLD
jgi:hypothetical protein